MDYVIVSNLSKKIWNIFWTPLILFLTPSLSQGQDIQQLKIQYTTEQKTLSHLFEIMDCILEIFGEILVKFGNNETVKGRKCLVFFLIEAYLENSIHSSCVHDNPFNPIGPGLF